MNLRVLFVDDEPNVLDGLRRSLRGFRHEWDMRYSTSGAAALDALATAPADVVVTDMRMPGMAGDELLAEVLRRHPQVVRIVLTGQCTREAMLRVTTLAHRVLTKPCDPDELKAAIRQASALQGLLQGPQLTTLVGRLRSVPSKPDLYTRILALLDQPEWSLTDLGQLCGQDVGVTAKLIQVANSAMFGGRQQCASAADAVRQIGMEMTKALVLANGVLTKFDRGSILPYSIDDLWLHSQAVGALANRIAQTEARGATWANAVPSLGVLHDIGRLVFASAEPDQYVQTLRLVQEEGLTLVEAEIRMFGVTHAEIGAYLLSLWGLPTFVVEAVAWHHAPMSSEGANAVINPASILYAAEAILGQEECGGINSEHWARLRLSDRLPIWTKWAAEGTVK